MLINFPNQLTSEEEQLLKKIAKMKKKKKLFSEKKTTKDSQAEALHATSTTNAASAAYKRTNSGQLAGKQIDAKEAAKKLIQSGIIKLETENKEKGFKRSCSRKDDIKKNLSLSSESYDGSNPNKQITYSSVSSPISAKSPPSSNSPFYNANKFSFSSSDQNSSQSPNFNPRNNSFRKNSFNQTPNSSFGGGDGNQQNSGGAKPRFQSQGSYNSYNNQQANGISLYVKANNVTEDLLRSIFNANVSQSKIISIDIKTGYAFVTVDTKEAADNAIQELNGKTFQDNVYSVSLARPRKTFNRNFSNNFERSGSNRGNNPNNNNSNEMNSNNPGFNRTPSFNPSSNNEAASGDNGANNMPSRQIINYEDV